MRRSPLVRGKWLFFLVLCVCMFVSVFYEFDEVSAFTVGTVGRPGERTFFLQVRADGRSINDHIDAMRLQMFGRTNAREHQYLRRAKGAA